MVTIQMTNSFRFTNPQAVQNPNAFFIELSQGGMLTPTYANQIVSGDASSGPRLGGPGAIRVRPWGSFSLSDQQFAILVSSSQQGDVAASDFISQILHLVDNKTLEVDHDGTPLTSAEIYTFTP